MGQHGGGGQGGREQAGAGLVLASWPAESREQAEPGGRAGGSPSRPLLAIMPAGTIRPGTQADGRAGARKAAGGREGRATDGREKCQVLPTPR